MAFSAVLVICFPLFLTLLHTFNQLVTIYYSKRFENAFNNYPFGATKLFSLSQIFESELINIYFMFANGFYDSTVQPFSNFVTFYNMSKSSLWVVNILWKISIFGLHFPLKEISWIIFNALLLNKTW